MSNVKTNAKAAKSLTDRTSLGNKVISVALSAVLLGFGWPVVNPAEVYAEDGAPDAAQTQPEGAQADQSGASENAGSGAAEGATPAEGAAGESAATGESADKLPTVEEAVSNANSASSADSASGADSANGAQAPAAEQPKADGESAAADDANGQVDVALSFANASMKYNNQTVTAPTTKLTLAKKSGAVDALKFTVEADNGYKLADDSVKLSVAGAAETAIAPDASGEYTVSSDDVLAGASIAISAEKDAASPENGKTNGTTAIENTEGKSNAESAGSIDKNAAAEEQAKEDAINQGTGAFADILGNLAKGDLINPANELSFEKGFAATYYLAPGESVTIPMPQDPSARAVVDSEFNMNGENDAWNNLDRAISGSNGVITAKETAKEAEYTVYWSVGYSYSADPWYQQRKTTYKIIVGEEPSLSVSPSKLEVNVGESSTDLEATVTPATATVTWSSEDPSIATVDSATGEVTGVKVGSTTITAKSNSGKTATVAVDVDMAGYSNQTAYFYLECAGAALNGNSYSDWLYAGTGTVYAPSDAEKGTSLTIGEDGFVTADPTYFLDKTIKVNDKTYVYDASGTHADGTYSIAWGNKIKRTERSSDAHKWANDPASGSQTEWLTESGSLDWHVDGTVTLNGEGLDAQYTEQDAYFYLARPDSAVNVNSTHTWLYAGMGTVKAPVNAKKGTVLSSGVDEMIQVAGNYYADKSFTIDGVTYTYDVDGTKAAGTYSVVWDVMRLVGGSTNSNKWDGEGGVENRLTPDTQLDWHVDGHIVLNTDQVDSKELAVKNAPQDVEYNGEKHRWTPEVIDARTSDALDATTDYAVAYSTEDFVNPGVVTATISGVGNYANANKLTATYTIKQIDTDTVKWIHVGESKTIVGTTSVSSGSNWWLDGSDNGVIEFTKNGDSATVKGLKVGTVELVHGYWKRGWKKEIYTIHVSEAQPAKSVSISGDDSVTQFASTQLSAATDPTDAVGAYTWASSNEDILTVDNDGNVTGVRQGTATVTVTFTSAADGSTVTASKDVTVEATTTSTDQALVYYLLDPTKDANSNDSGNWGPKYGEASVNVDGATWTNDKNCFDNVDQRVVSWPNGTNVVPRDSDAWNQIFNNYKSTIQAQLPGIDFTKDDVEEIALVPAKISKGNGTNPDKHLDCNVTIKCKNVSLVKYYLRDAGGTQFEQKGSKNYVSGSTTQPSDVTAEQFPATKTVDGVTYTFSGWYLDQNFTQPVTFPYTVNGSTNFYAKYVGGFQVIYDLDGGTWGNSDATMYGAQEGTVQTVKSEPTREGYKFTGWTVEGLSDTTTLNSGDTFTMPAGNVTIKANWRQLPSCQVNYLEQGTNNVIHDASTRYGEVGAALTEEAIDIDGYHVVSETPQTLIFAESGNAINFYYVKNFVDYKVNYYLNGTEQEVADSETKSVAWGSTVKASDLAKDISGYTVVPGQDATITVNLDGNNTINVYYYQNVDLVANSDTKTYNGGGQSVSGFTGAPEGADFSAIRVGATGTNAGTYPANFADGTVGTIDATGKYIVKGTQNGELKIGPVTQKVTVTIKGHQETETYNGFEQSVTGYDFSVNYDFSANNGLYTQSNVKFTGDATAKGTAVGTYNMNLVEEQFSNTSNNFSNVEFVVEDGWLKIDGGQIDQNDVVWNTHDSQKVYDGTPLAAYTASATDKYGNALNVEYSTDGETWTSDPSKITITHFGYRVVQLRATGSNYADGQYATSSERIAITKRLVTLTSEGGTKPYDGTALTNGTVTATPKGAGVGFVDGEGVSFNVTGSQTEAGESDNTFTYSFNKGTDKDDYEVTTKYGKLIVAADDTEVVVTITEKSDSFEYDGNEKSVSGYDFEASNELYKETDFTFSGNDTVKHTNVGTYDMELKPSDFTNNNKNFSKVTFVIVDGQLTITPKSIVTGENMTVEAPKDVMYNGQLQQEKPVVKDGEKTLTEKIDYTLSYSKDTTNAGAVTVTVTGQGNYSGSVDVIYQILKRSVVLESATDSKPYDGTALTKPDVAMTGDGFVDGEVTNIRATGSVTTVADGEVTNTIVYGEGVNFKANNYIITKNEGKLSITALSAEDGLTITPHNVEYTYNAESHSAGAAAATASVDGTNVSLEYRVKGSPDTEWRSDASVITAINAGAVTIEVRASAPNYSGYKYAEQTLTINKRDVELTSASASKVYDGTALANDWVDMGPNRADTGFIWSDLAGDGQVHATGSQTAVGTSDNTISYQLKEGAANNYNILPNKLGTLTVTAQSIVPDPENPESYTGATISNPSDSVYNGEDHKWTPEVKDAKGKALVEGTDYTASYDTSEFIDVKTITVTITGKGNYTGAATKTYKITPAPLTVNANSDSKVYDGKALTAGGTIEGLVGKETATAKTEGSQTEVGFSANKVVGIEWGTAKAGNYYIQSQKDGTLTVTGKSIVASGMTVGVLPDVVYSGTEQVQKPEVKDGEKTLVEGVDYGLTFSEDKTNVGTVTVTVTGKGNYTGEVTRTYQITPATLTVTTPSDSKVYNGEALTAEGAISGFVNGETAAFTTTGSQTEVGSSTNTYAIDWAVAGSTAKQGNYTISENLGTLAVTETTDEIVATPGTYNGTYDGQAHGVDVTVTDLPKGYSVKTAVSYATATDVTDGVTANIDDLVIVNAQGIDVTANLKVTKGTGTIKITPATLKVTTYGAKAEYTGTALTAGGKVTGFMNNEAATFTTTGSQTEVGSSTNTYTIDWNDTAKESNYTIEEDLGTLEVTSNTTAIMVIPQGGSKPYDGTELTSAGVTTYGLPAGYTLTAKTKGSVTNVGGATAEIDTYTITNAAGEDVTKQFGNVFTGKAALQVTKRPVTVASASASKVYDGTALTKHEANVVEGSFATDEGFSYEFSGEQTAVGSTSNAYIIKAGANTDLNNYDITKVDGTLTVTAQSIDPIDPIPGAYTGVEVDSPSDITYDANEHKWAPTVADKDGNVLVEGTDYDVTYSTNDFTNVTGTIVVTIVGKGNYTGTATRTYQIMPASVALSSNTHEFTYTGEPQGDAKVNVSGAAELFQSQVNDLKATGTVTNVADGTVANPISYTWKDGFTANNYIIETSFGELSVVAKSIDSGKDMSVNAPVDVTYNGNDQTWAPTVTDGEKTLREGVDYKVTYSTDDRTNVTGTITVTITGKGNYAGTVTRTYQITPKGYTVVTGSASKVYDGTPLLGTDSKIDPLNEIRGLVNANDAALTVTGAQTEVGSSDNTYEIKFAPDQMAANYKLESEQVGKLTVTENADEIVVTTTGGTFTYDGQAHGATSELKSPLPAGYTLDKIECTTTVTNVADSKDNVGPTTLIIRNAEGKDVTNDLNINYVNGSITITPASLTVTTGSASKYYDGTPLTNNELKVDGLIEGDSVAGTTTGTQTDIGQSDNTYELTWPDDTTKKNYEVAVENLGKLTVYAYVPPTPTPEPGPGPTPPTPEPPTPGPEPSPTPTPTPEPTPEPTPATPDTPTTPDAPVAPTTPTTPADTATSSNPVVDTVVTTLENVYEAVTGDEVQPEEKIYDSENPLGTEQAPHCWVHWYMLVFMVLTAIYGAGVCVRRRNFTRRLEDDMNAVLKGDEKATPGNEAGKEE